MTPLPIITPSPDTHHPHSPNIDLRHRNIPANTHKEVDDWFHHVFTQQSQTIPQTHPDNIQSFTTNPSSLSDSLSHTADPVSATDVEFSLNSRLLHASHSSPGHDHITYLLLKHAPQQLITLLTKLYNSSLFLGYLPSSAKTSHITVIPNPHLDHKLPKNFRPLSLTPSIWKILEGILHSRIMHHMEHNHLINNSNSHSTFNAGYIIFSLTETHSSNSFIIYVNDIPITSFVYSSQFADDTAAVSTSLRSNTAAEHMQSIINAFTIWADSWKITLHPDKSCFISYPIHLSIAISEYSWTATSSFHMARTKSEAT